MPVTIQGRVHHQGYVSFADFHVFLLVMWFGLGIETEIELEICALPIFQNAF